MTSFSLTVIPYILYYLQLEVLKKTHETWYTLKNYSFICVGGLPNLGPIINWFLYPQ